MTDKEVSAGLRGALAVPAKAHEKHKNESPVFSESDLTFWHSIGGCVPDRFEVAYSPLVH